jgi:hypothetical protein
MNPDYQFLKKDIPLNMVCWGLLAIYAISPHPAVGQRLSKRTVTHCSQYAALVTQHRAIVLCGTYNKRWSRLFPIIHFRNSVSAIERLEKLEPGSKKFQAIHCHMASMGVKSRRSNSASNCFTLPTTFSRKKEFVSI